MNSPATAVSILLLAFSPPFCLDAAARDRDGGASFGDFDPGELPRLLQPGFDQVRRTMNEESQQRQRTAVKIRAIRCFDQKRTVASKQWQACGDGKAGGAACAEISTCRTSGAFASVTERHAVICDESRSVFPAAKWKSCLKLKNVKKNGPAEKSCSQVLACERSGAFVPYP